MGIMQLLNIFLFWLFLGCLASYFAKKRGRSPVLWFILGMVLGVIGIGVLWLLPKVAVEAPPQTGPQLGPQPDQQMGQQMGRHEELWKIVWYYLDRGHKQQGPVELPDLITQWKAQGISEKSYIWGEGMKEWQQLCDLPDLLSTLKQLP